jgi:hypothetical protein
MLVLLLFHPISVDPLGFHNKHLLGHKHRMIPVMVKVGPKATILAHPTSLIVVALARGVNIGLIDHLHVHPLVIRSGVLKRWMHAEGYWGSIFRRRRCRRGTRP